MKYVAQIVFLIIELYLVIKKVKMETKLASSTLYEVDINADETVIKKEIKIEPNEYNDNNEQLYNETECLYPDISMSEVDPLNVECKQETSEEYIIKSEEVETNIDDNNVMYATTSNLPVEGGKYNSSYNSNPTRKTIITCKNLLNVSCIKQN